MNFCVTGGGTGGHFFPAIIIAEKLKNNNKVFYVGSDYGIESELIINYNIPFLLTKSRGFIGKPFFKKIFSLILNFYSIIKCIIFFLKNKIDVVYATGGYVSLPVLAAGVVLNKKMYLQEQNSYPGMTTRLFSRFAVKIFLAFNETEEFIKTDSDKIVYVNTPVRDEFYNKFQIKKNTVLVNGGSQGSKIINKIISENIDYFVNNNIELFWVTGKMFYQQYKNYNKDNIIVFEFLNDIYDYIGKSEIIVSRAGATSIAEYKTLNKKVLFIPFEKATHNHQKLNAQSYNKKYLSEILYETEYTKLLFKKKIEILFNQKTNGTIQPETNAADIILNYLPI